MDSAPIDQPSSATELKVIMSRPEPAFSVLNAAKPPSLCFELTSSVRSAVSPCGHKSSSSLLQCIVSAFHGLFPIICWGRKYDLKSFRRDLLAGLTIASLGIPQVIYSVLFLWSAIYGLNFKPLWCLYMQSIGYANLAKIDPQYGLCMCTPNLNS